ncbi:hypothetical protein SteCoe_16123 [Stentor coeruleus]|uniref:Uncharacterized protein n=1 Tax=Stentor coeruleus TaxID=5963 RepID=A0A1R2C223_9CILI|nr:hypothetical protein SteCoe_16123 [Stentor coeruleus]
MAEIKSLLPESPKNKNQSLDEHTRLLSGLFSSEKYLLKLIEGLPLENQSLFLNKIQSLSQKRLSLISKLKNKDPCKDTILSISELNDEYNECLQSMISEIVEETESPEYNEMEIPSKHIRQRSIKGMIIGNFNEVLENMDKLLTFGEKLMVLGYQKLFIDSDKIKGKLQSVIDERKNLVCGNKPIDILVEKQGLLEKQMNCLVGLFDEANTLTDLIGKLQEFDKKQIQLQKTSQVTVDSFRKFFYKPDSRKTSERRRTYLCVNYADPDTTREGLDILKDQVNSIVRNINIISDMEDAKVRAINKSDLGDKCEIFYDQAKESLDEEKQLLTETFEILTKFEENPEVINQYEKLINSFTPLPQKPTSQLETIKLLIENSIQERQKRLDLATTLKVFLEKYDESVSQSIEQSVQLQTENLILIQENTQLKSQTHNSIIDKISQGTNNLKELFEYQEHMRKKIQESIEQGFKEKILELIMLNSGTTEILLGVNPVEDIRIRVMEYETDFNKIGNMSDLLEILSKYQTVTFRLVCKLAMVNERYVYSNILRLRNAKSLKEARESVEGKPIEYPMTKVDRAMSDVIRCYVAEVEEKKGNMESLVRKQNVVGKLLSDFKG